MVPGRGRYGGAIRNWAGTYVYRARAVHRPATVAEVQRIVARAPRVRALGSRHSFSDIGDSAELVSLGALPAEVTVDGAGRTVSFGGGVTYGELAGALAAHGLALHNLASLPHTSVAGAVATATHGSGDRSGNLATAVAELSIVTSAGDLVSSSRGDPDFDGLVVGLGALGVVVRLSLDVEPAYRVRQRVYEGLGWDALAEHFDAITASGDSVSLFTHWGDAAGQVWVKERAGEAPERDELFGAVPARVARHPIPGMDPANCTAQLGEPGPWHDRLPHFRWGATPSSGAELQSEYLVARRDAVAAIDAVRRIGAAVRPVLQVSEIRTVAADRLWMSPQYGRDSVGIHFTWVPDHAAVERAVGQVEDALAPFRARPHWGKLFLARAATVAPLYGRAGDFARLAGRVDPRGAFTNRWLERHVLGA
jgi:xylitol oxidase